jgi:hypothetical protein
MISLAPNEVERRFALLRIPNRFTDQEKTALATTQTVVADEGILAFATPQANAGLNLLNLRVICGTEAARPPSFFDHPWYLDEAFMRADCAAGWHYIYTDVLVESISRSVDYASSLATRGLDLPSAVELTLMLFLHYVGTGEQLLGKKHSWCKDLASHNRSVTVGAFGRNGLFISSHPGDFTSRGLGICAKIKR